MKIILYILLLTKSSYCLLIIALIKKSLFKWLFNLSISNILAGVITFIGSFALGVFANYVISEKLNSSVSVEILPYLLSALAIFGIGVLILIVYLILRGIFKNKKELAK